MRASTQLLWLSGHLTNRAVLILGDFPSSQGDSVQYHSSRGALMGCLGDIVWRRLGGDILLNDKFEESETLLNSYTVRAIQSKVHLQFSTTQH
jgi:hypothetical protein